MCISLFVWVFSILFWEKVACFFKKSFFFQLESLSCWFCGFFFLGGVKKV